MEWMEYRGKSEEGRETNCLRNTRREARIYRVFPGHQWTGMMFEAFQLLAALCVLGKTKGKIHQWDRLGPFQANKYLLCVCSGQAIPLQWPITPLDNSHGNLRKPAKNGCINRLSNDTPPFPLLPTTLSLFLTSTPLLQQPFASVEERANVFKYSPLNSCMSCMLMRSCMAGQRSASPSGRKDSIGGSS